VSAQGVEGEAFTLTVSVNPAPKVADQEIEVCSGEELGVDFNASSTIAVASYEITEILIDGSTNITGINTIADFSVGSGTPRQGTGFSANEISDDLFINETSAAVEVEYTVVPVSIDGCEGDAFKITVIVNPKLGDADFSITPSVIFDDLYGVDDPILFKNTSLNPYELEYLLTWYIDGEEVSDQEEFNYIFSRTGSYEVMLEVTYEYLNNFICIYSKSETINVTEKFDLIIPNAFTPNNDGFNDFIRPLSKYVQNIEMSIYDIWGVLLYYEKNDTILKGWDGYVNGELAPVGNYTLVVKGTTFSGNKFVENKAIRLIR